jgi:hypothetical protein
MKTSSILLVALSLLAIASQSCTDEYSRIEGMGSITTQTLNIDNFSSILLEGADDVDISYGTEQKVEVTGHPNIISRIKTDVRNGRWDMGLENGNYGRYELRYSLTLPVITGVEIIGSSNVTIQDSIQVGQFDLLLMGSGSFYGFKLRSCQSFIEIIGSGNCEITTEEQMDVIIEGSGSVFYKGQPSIQTDITGSGEIVGSN